MLRKIIDRPVLATVISIILLILGIIGLLELPITRFPDISPPTVLVRGNFPGGNSETVLRSAVTPLEEQINGVENMRYIKSTVNNDGSFGISVIFKQGVDPDLAAVNVQNRVQRATSILPEEVVRQGISTSKQQNSMVMFFDIYTDDDSKYDELFIQNYVNINVVPQLKRVSGVGQVQIWSAKDYAMRVWLNPQKMTSYRLTPNDIKTAIAKQNIEASPGRLGEESNAALQYVIRYKGKKNLPEEYDNIVVKRENNNLIRLKDIARVEFGSISYSGESRSNRKNAISMGVLQATGSNARDIEIGIINELEKASKAFPPGMKYHISMSSKNRLDEATNQVNKTLIEAFILVFIVVFIFLQDFRSTIIAAIAVPVAIIGTFFILLVLGFTINILTLFALVLAIGIVVDDAIVVIEAVHSKMEGSSLSAREATHSAMSEITGAVISITLVMAAVFIPIGFMSGSAGLFYKQFAYTLATAIIISSVNALTLTPALCALLLKNNHHYNENKQTYRNRFFIAFNAGFNNLTNKYVSGVHLLIKKKWLGTGFIISTIVAAALLMGSTSKSFVPMEDDNFIIYGMTLPPGTGLEKTTAATKKLDSILATIDELEIKTTIAGYNVMSDAAGNNYAGGWAKLKDPKNRKKLKTIESIQEEVEEKLGTLEEGSIYVFRLPPVEGYGTMSGAEVMIQDRMGKDPTSLKAMADKIMNELRKQKGVKSVSTTFRADFPQFELEVDEDKANQLDVDVDKMMETVQTYFAGDFSQNFIRFGKFYRVAIKADGIFRMDEDAFNEIFVKNEKGDMVPVKSIIRLKKMYGPEMMQRYNLYNALSINIESDSEISNGALMETLEKNVFNKMPSGYSYEWTGLSLEEKSSGNQSMIIVILSLLFVYFLLAAQYESYLLPLAVLLSIPAGIIGAFLGIKLFGLDNNIYVQVGLIMLIGLLAKNAILIVEFAMQRRKAGLSITKAAMEGAKARLRPIIMTSLAFMAGIIPLMFTSGGTAAGNKSISSSATFGMLSGVILGIFTIPLLYIFFQHLQEKISGNQSIK
ncbi:efflux RND transporter permease subunit [Chryseobacterium sp. MYb328]|uniref:efflux RND transporter permease subunit n=1 Tax=Chryseobacterium sp. MYb328 TaxID=2745231 RepID=UPI0030A91B24